MDFFFMTEQFTDIKPLDFRFFLHTALLFTYLRNVLLNTFLILDMQQYNITNMQSNKPSSQLHGMR